MLPSDPGCAANEERTKLMAAELPTIMDEPTDSDASPTTNRVKDLPVELLAQIFSAWTFVDEDGPWMASAVCKHWRAVALDTKEIWRHITIRFHHEPQADEAWCVEEDDLQRALSPRGKRRPLELWLDRARDAKLSLHLAVHPLIPRLDVELGTTLRIMSQHLASLGSLVITVDGSDIACTILDTISKLDTVNYHLQYLEVNIYDKHIPKHLRPNPEDLVLPPAFWESAPLVRHYVFRGCFPSPFNGPARHYIRTLTLGPMLTWSKSLVELVKSCPLLEELTLHNLNTQTSHSEGRVFSVTAPITMQCLQALRLTAVPTKEAAHLLNVLVMPQLRKLSVGNLGTPELRKLWADNADAKWYDVMHVFGSALIHCVLRAPHLKVLELHRSPLDDRHVVQMLENLPSLRELRLDTLLIGRPAIRGLTPSPGKGEGMVLCPHLRELVIKRCESIQKAHLVALLKARNTLDESQCEPITEVHITECSGFKEEDMAAIKSVDARLRVSYTEKCEP